MNVSYSMTQDFRVSPQKYAVNQHFILQRVHPPPCGDSEVLLTPVSG